MSSFTKGKGVEKGTRVRNPQDSFSSSWMKEAEKFVTRLVDCQEIRLHIYHAGLFIDSPCKMYVRGQMEEMNWGWDTNVMSYQDITKLIKSIGYREFKSLYYRHPKLALSRGLRQLNCDNDVLKFIEDVKEYEVVEIYVEHLVDTPIITEEGILDKGKVKAFDEKVIIDVEYEYEANGEGEVDSVSVVGESKAKGGGDDEFVEDEEYVANCEDVSDDYTEDESDFEENWDWTSVLPEETVNEVNANAHQTENVMNLDPIMTADVEVENDDSDILVTPPGSDDDEATTAKFPTFRMPEGDGVVKFELGMIFTVKYVVKNVVKQYAMERKKNLFFQKNDKKRMVVRCLKDCPFYLRFSKRSAADFWQIVSFNEVHSCHRIPENRQATTGWLAKKFIPTLRHTPDMKTKGLIAECKDKWGVKLSDDQAYRAKKRAIEMIQGAGSEQYSHLRSYAEELRRSNPNSTVIIKCDTGINGPVFERIYVCLEACKAAFAYTCRPLIGLDACFLKGEHGGQLMAAVGKDANNQMIPIAYAVVEAETKDSWQWFLDLLLEDLDGIQRREWAFISDQQKGLIQAVQNVRAGVEHRLCVKHLYGNLKKRYPDAELKEVMWLAARATTVPDWQRAMQRMKDIKENAWKEMMQHPPGVWTRSAYSSNTQCDLQVNNMCEAFNKAILEPRDKPVITLLEGLKNYISRRIVTQREMMQRYTGNICPKIQELLEKAKRAADGWSPHWAGDIENGLFYVENGKDQFAVNLLKRTCACRKWDLSGIPCPHSISCIWHNKENPENYVATYYRKATFMATYSHIILPSNGPKLWPIIDSEPINPPRMRRAPGRPKKQRNKSNDEPKNRNQLPRHVQTVKCKKCGKFGHNSRTCKGKTVADREIPKGGNNSRTKNVAQNSAQGAAQNTAHGSTQTSAQVIAQTTAQGAAQSIAQVQIVMSQGSQAPTPSQA